MGQPHKHADIIKAWADGAEIQMRCPDFENWQDMDTPTWHEVLEYRIKPEPPKYPQTKMTDGQLKRAFHAANGETQKGWRGIANAAIARAIEDGQVFTADSVKQALEAGAGCEMVPIAMLEKVAMAVHRRALEVIDAKRSYTPLDVGFNSTRFQVAVMGLDEIIASVKENK